jgi:hypothetical protein
MVIKYNRSVITSINNTQSGHSNTNTITDRSRKIAVPEKDTFKYIFENAKKGNEMAAVLLDEWQRSCKPKDVKEEQIIRYINKAANQIFR